MGSQLPALVYRVLRILLYPVHGGSLCATMVRFFLVIRGIAE